MTARAAQKSEVNITPFVDVMLVLLIIFMVAAPLATTKIDVNIPPPGPTLPQTVAPVFVSLQKDGSLHVGSQSLGEATADWRSLLPLLRQKASGNFGAPVFVRADHDVGYGEVMRLIDTIRAGGYGKVSIVTEDVVE